MLGGVGILGLFVFFFSLMPPFSWADDDGFWGGSVIGFIFIVGGEVWDFGRQENGFSGFFWRGIVCAKRGGGL